VGLASGNAQNGGESWDIGKGSAAGCKTGSRESASDAMSTFINFGGITMWTKPEYTEMRFGFEVTMYIANR
jgi:coenzyme PQQ precursor peptide PqqA